MTNDQVKAIMIAIIYIGYNISNGWGISDKIDNEKGCIDVATEITEEICSRYTTME